MSGSDSESGDTDMEEVLMFKCTKCDQVCTEAEKDIHRVMHRQQKKAGTISSSQTNAETDSTIEKSNAPTASGQIPSQLTKRTTATKRKKKTPQKKAECQKKKLKEAVKKKISPEEERRLTVKRYLEQTASYTCYSGPFMATCRPCRSGAAPKRGKKP